MMFRHLSSKTGSKSDQLPTNPPNFTNSSNNIKPHVKKIGSAFDDYQQRNSKRKLGKNKNQDVSNSGDFYQSQGYKGLEKPFATNSNADKGSVKHQNLVFGPLLNNQQLRNGFKSPGNKPQNRVSIDQDSNAKRIGQFGGKKQGTGKFLQDNFEAKKDKLQNDHKIAFEPLNSPKTQHQHLPSFPGLNLSKKKLQVKLNGQRSPKDKGCKSNVPKFVQNLSIKSSPFLKKYRLDSSNQQSVGQKLVKQPQKVVKQVPLLEQFKRQKEKQDKKKNKEQDQLLSFNKGQMFFNLKTRQEMHSMLIKEINILGVNLQVKVMSSEGDKITTFLTMQLYNSKTQSQQILEVQSNQLQLEVQMPEPLQTFTSQTLQKIPQQQPKKAANWWAAMGIIFLCLLSIITGGAYSISQRQKIQTEWIKLVLIIVLLGVGLLMFIAICKWIWPRRNINQFEQLFENQEN